MTLFTGQLIAQSISLLVGFVITRIYLPEQIGVYSSFVAVVTILTIISTGRYDAAIVIEEDEEKVKSLWGLSLIVSLVFNSLLFVVLYFFSGLFLNYLDLSNSLGLLLLIPVAVFIGSIISATQFYFNKYASYTKMKNADIIKSATNSAFSVGFGYLKFLNSGLIWANILGGIFSTGFLLIRLPANFWKGLKTAFSKEKLQSVAKKYKNYLTLYSLSGLLNALVSNGTPIFIIFFFTEKVAGYYFMAEKVISIPLGFVVASISKVFYQKANELYQEDKTVFLSFIGKIQKRMAIFLIPFLLILSIVSPYLFQLFGEGWEQAGEMVKYFAILVFFNNLVSPVGAISNILNRLDILLYFNISIAFFRGLTFYLGSLYLNFENALLLSSIVISICYLVFDQVLKKKIKEEINKG